MLDSNTAALDKHEADELMRSYIDDAAERNLQIAQWREDRKADLIDDTKAMTDALFLQLDGSEMTEELLAVLREHWDAPVFRPMRAVVDKFLERLLDAEQALEDFR